MELQLGLALVPTDHHRHNIPARKGFDLNNHGFDPKEMVGLEPLSHGCCFDEIISNKNYVKKKRGFDMAFEKIGDHAAKQTLPLLLWNGQPNEEDDRKEQKKRASSNINKNDGEENNRVVGWPPIKSWRKKLLHQHQDGPIENDRMAEKERGGAKYSKYVKVKMEGVAIARKINPRLYHSYQTLTNTLISMFAKYQKGDKYGARYTLTYQDKEGDWLLAGDVPWQTFIESVQRLEILRNGAG